jgi:hypothetical protein
LFLQEGGVTTGCGKKMVVVKGRGAFQINGAKRISNEEYYKKIRVLVGAQIKLKFFFHLPFTILSCLFFFPCSSPFLNLFQESVPMVGTFKLSRN